MELEHFNVIGEHEAAEVVRPCVGIDSWVAAIVAARPYADRDALLAMADRAATTWTDEEVEGALADHPRIGERASGSNAGATMSRTEQAGVSVTDVAMLDRLAEGNRRYEEKFGRIYLVRAAGRSAAEMLDLLEHRLTNDPTTELGVTKTQLVEIATLRLKALIS